MCEDVLLEGEPRQAAEREELSGAGGVDGAGNTSNRVPASPTAASTVMLDGTAPTLPTISDVPGGCVVGPVTVSAGGSSDAMSGLDHHEFTLNGGNTQTGQAPRSRHMARRP